MGGSGELDVGDFGSNVGVVDLGSEDVGVIEIEDGVDLVKDLVGDFAGDEGKREGQELVEKRNIERVFVEMKELVDLAQQAAGFGVVFHFQENEKHVVGVVLRRACLLKTNGTTAENLATLCWFLVMVPRFDHEPIQHAVDRHVVLESNLFELV